MIVLHPVVVDGKRVPGLFEDPFSKREPTFVQEIVRNEIVYSHESGYGYLREQDVCIMEHV